MVIRRKIKVIDRNIQVGVPLKVLLCLACYILLFFVLTLFAPLSTMITGGAGSQEVFEARQEIDYVVNTIVLPLVFAFVCMALHVMLLLHRLAGPIFRFNRVLDSMRERDLSAYAGVRTGDYLKETSERFEIVLARYSEDLGLLRTEAEAALEDMKSSRSTEAMERCEAMLEIIDRYTLRKISTCDPVPETAGRADEVEADRPGTPAAR